MSIPVFRTVASFREWRRSIGDSSLGFVPTMGALHEGHLSLVKESLSKNHYTVVSIFVNPSQFAPTEDLDSYPRTFEKDYQILSNFKSNVDNLVILAPTVFEMYPSGITLNINEQKGAFISVLGVSEQLEGKTRPNFFRGVATVVLKLFNIVNANFAYFGQKDFQQTVVLQKMVKDLLLPVEIVVLPIVRENSGLALSSRNSYLSDGLKDKCNLIYEGLIEAKLCFDNNGKRFDIIKTVESKLTDPIFQIDYVSIADKETLEEIDDLSKGGILSIAVYVTENDKQTRLIDNIVL